MPLDATLMTIGRRHLNGITALLVATGYPVHVVEVTGTDVARPIPYHVVYPDPGTAGMLNLGAEPDDFTFGWQVTTVGRDWTETLHAVDRCRAALTGQRPTVAERNCGLIVQTVGDQPIRQDPSGVDPGTSRPVFYGITRFVVRTTAA